MDNSFVDITNQANRILCQCPNPECGKISRFSEILVEPGKISKPTWLDDHKKNTDDFGIAANKFAISYIKVICVFLMIIKPC